MKKIARAMAALAGLLLCFTLTHATQLHKAIEKGDLEKVKKLLATNAALLNQSDDELECPLHYAIDDSQTAIAEYLIQQGADVNCESDGDSPLFSAV